MYTQFFNYDSWNSEKVLKLKSHQPQNNPDTRLAQIQRQNATVSAAAIFMHLLVRERVAIGFRHKDTVRNRVRVRARVEFWVRLGWAG